MAAYEDSKPFVGLQQDAKDLQTLVVDGVKRCLDHLDSKLSSLVCDPDSLQYSIKDSKRLNAQLEFTKAKYEIYVHMKSLVEEIDAALQKKLNNMINDFLENVEILLAGMKLESLPEIVHKESSSVSKKPKGHNLSPSSIISSMSPYSLLNTAKRIPVLNSFLPKGGGTEDDITKRDIEEEETSDEDNEALVTQSPFQRKFKKIAIQKPDIEEEETSDENNEAPEKQTTLQRKCEDVAVLKPESAIYQKRNRRKSILKTETENDLHTTPSRSTRKRTAVKEINQSNLNDIVESNESDYEISTVTPKTPKNVHFSLGFDVNEDLDIYSPEVKLNRSVPRRKTMLLADATECTSNNNLLRNRAKRKTIGSSTDVLSVAPSPKRLKRGTKMSIAPQIHEESDPLESDGRSEGYTPWQLLDELDGKIPALPGVYELKVYKAKKSAYIGSCENLQHKLTLHKVGHSSGHRHLDKFLERNKKDVQVRFERMSSVEQAKNEEMKRIKAFVEQHKTTPAYN